MTNTKKLASTFPNMVIVLTVVALISALALSFTYSSTKKAREMVEVKRTLKALKEVLPGFDNDPNSEKYSIAEFAELEFYPAKREDQPVGTAIKTYSDKGFTERIWLMVGFDIENKIHKIAVLKQRETPGLGTKMKEPRFKKQFNSKNPTSFKLKVKKDGGDVDAITAATVSSRAFCEAVNRAYHALLKARTSSTKETPKSLPPAARNLFEKRFLDFQKLFIERRSSRWREASSMIVRAAYFLDFQKLLLSRFATNADTHRGQFLKRGGEK